MEQPWQPVSNQRPPSGARHSRLARGGDGAEGREERTVPVWRGRAARAPPDLPDLDAHARPLTTLPRRPSDAIRLLAANRGCRFGGSRELDALALGQRLEPLLLALSREPLGRLEQCRRRFDCRGGEGECRRRGLAEGCWRSWRWRRRMGGRGGHGGERGGGGRRRRARYRRGLVGWERRGEVWDGRRRRWRARAGLQRRGGHGWEGRPAGRGCQSTRVVCGKSRRGGGARWRPAALALSSMDAPFWRTAKRDTARAKDEATEGNDVNETMGQGKEGGAGGQSGRGRGDGAAVGRAARRRTRDFDFHARGDSHPQVESFLPPTPTSASAQHSCRSPASPSSTLPPPQSSCSRMVSQAGKDIIAGTAGGVAQVRPRLPAAPPLARERAR